MDVSEFYKHEPLVKMVSEVTEYFNALTLEDTAGATENQDTDPDADAWKSDDDDDELPILLSLEEQSDSSLDASSIDGSSLAFSEDSATSETSVAVDGTSIHSNDVPEEQDIEEDESDDSPVSMIDNLEVVSGDAYKWGKGACHISLFD